MMWHIDLPSCSWTGGEITPSEVLYSYDGPLIFTAKMGLFGLLYLKIDELGDTDLFLVTQTTDEIVNALRRGLISVRGALDQRSYWIVETKSGLQALRYWRANRNEIPESYLPEPGVGLFSSFGVVPDTLEQATAFFAVKFTGGMLTDRSMPFRTFKSLVDSAYDSLFKLLSPTAIGVRLSDIFDFEVLQPKFSSLVIAVNNPTINEPSSRRNSLLLDIQSMETEVEENRSQFFDLADSMLRQAQGGEINSDFASDNFRILDALSSVVPGEDGRFERVEFNATTRNGRRSVSVDGNLGEKIKRARRLAETETVSKVGVIVEVNSESSTFVMKSSGDRQTTCALEKEVFYRLQHADMLRVGNKISVRGEFKRRSRRDFMQVKAEPIFR